MSTSEQIDLFLSSFPAGETPLAELIITKELDTRPSREPNYELENIALKKISKLLSVSPLKAMKALADQALIMCGGDSAGISISETENENPIFRWHAVSGVMAPHEQGIMPRSFSPCGVVCDTVGPVLIRDISRHYKYVEGVGVYLHEALLVPLFLEDNVIGTIWVIAHNPDKKFDLEDKRILDSLAEFSSNVVPYYLRAKALNDANPDLNNYFKLHDITDEVKARKLIETLAISIADEKQKQDAIINQSPAGIALMRGPKFIFEKVNAKFTELVGPREYIGKPWVEVYHELPDSPLPAIMTRVIETGETYVAREQLIKVMGNDSQFEERFYDIEYSRVLDSTGRPYGICCQCADVTYYVSLRSNVQENSKSLATTIDKLEMERDLRERFVAALTHDLRTPLAAAKMSSQLLARKLNEDPKMFKTAHRITENMDRADDMIRDILDASSIKAGEKVHLRIQHCQLDNILFDVIEDLEGIHGDKFQTKIDKGIEGYWDLDGMKRVIENLLSNAIKYGEVGSKVTVTTKISPESVSLSIHNKGFPIPKEELNTLFDQFKRAQTAQLSGQKGWGLGLTLVKGITESHGGKVSVESTADHGTTFFIDIPLDSRDL